MQGNDNKATIYFFSYICIYMPRHVIYMCALCSICMLFGLSWITKNKFPVYEDFRSGESNDGRENNKTTQHNQYGQYNDKTYTTKYDKGYINFHRLRKDVDL